MFLKTWSLSMLPEHLRSLCQPDQDDQTETSHFNLLCFMPCCRGRQDPHNGGQPARPWHQLQSHERALQVGDSASKSKVKVKVDPWHHSSLEYHGTELGNTEGSCHFNTSPACPDHVFHLAQGISQKWLAVWVQQDSNQFSYIFGKFFTTCLDGSVTLQQLNVLWPLGWQHQHSLTMHAQSA